MKYTIAVLAGDGIGPEVMDAALAVLRRVQEKYSVEFVFREALIGGAALDATGEPLPGETREICRASDAVLLGSVGGPKWDALPPEKRPERGGLLALRKEMSLYANLRPVRIYPSISRLSPLKAERIDGGVDLLTVRELAGGIYFGEPKHREGDTGLDTMIYDAESVRRIARIAFDSASKRRGLVTSVDKANVLYSSLLWRDVVEEVSADYPEIQLEHMYVDNAAMQLIINPGRFDVILTGNLFGDILSDESAALPGSLGLLPSASLGPAVHLYEPAGGSAPDIAGKGIANPIAQILSAAMMCEYSLDLGEAAGAIRDAVEETIREGILPADLVKDGSTKTYSTREITNAVTGNI
ncbi:MAG: 3-isopropylmalate dehydrogenase [Sediminispirochaetaceae bacterium]